jgi:hypothetical protein
VSIGVDLPWHICGAGLVDAPTDVELGGVPTDAELEVVAWSRRRLLQVEDVRRQLLQQLEGVVWSQRRRLFPRRSSLRWPLPQLQWLLQLENLAPPVPRLWPLRRLQGPRLPACCKPLQWPQPLMLPWQLVQPSRLLPAIVAGAARPFG